MIFVGNGALLKHGIAYTLSQGYTVDMVYCSSDDLIPYFQLNSIPFRVCQNINKEIEDFKKIFGDRIVFSLNNPWIFEKELLSLKEFRFYNIHNGLLPAYRGMPIVCIIYAILNGEKEYGVSLHEIDAGIDTGPCIDRMKFAISEDASFEGVMTTSLQLCKDIFEVNLSKVVKGECTPIPVHDSISRLYSIKDLSKLHLYQSNENLKRATYLGIYRIWYRGIHEIITKQLQS